MKKTSIADMFTERQLDLINNARKYSAGAPPASPERQLYIIICKYKLLCQQMAAAMHGSDVAELVRSVMELKIGDRK